MRCKERHLSKVLIKNFVCFSLAVVALLVLISYAFNKITSNYAKNMIPKEYIIDVTDVTDYSTINLSKLNDIGGWLEILDENYNTIYPTFSRNKYNIDDIIALNNGEYSSSGKNYFGRISQFLSKDREKRIQITFIPEEKVTLSLSVSVNLNKDTIIILVIALISLILFVFGYIFILIVVAKNINIKLTSPISNIVSAMQKVGNGDYSTRLESYSEFEFVEMQEAFNKMVIELETLSEKNANEEYLRNQLISEIGHDLKTPLTVIQGYAALINKRNANEEARIYSGKMLKNCDEIKAMLKILVDYSKLSRVDYKLELEMTDIAELLRTSVVEKYNLFIQNNSEVQIEIPDKEIDIMVDPMEIKRAIVNLMDNTVVHNNKGTKVMIELEESRNQVNIIIADSGIEIHTKVKNMIFEPFIKEKTTFQNVDNHGLGLSISKKIVEKHNGIIEIKQPYKDYVKAFIIVLYKK